MVSGGRDFSVKAAVGFCASSFALVPIHFINFLSLVCIIALRLVIWIRTHRSAREIRHAIH